MNKPKPTSRFNLYTLLMLLLLLLLTFAKVSVFASIEDDDDDHDNGNGKTRTVIDDEMIEFEELLEVDEEEERLNQNPDDIKAKLSEAQVLSRAQRIVLELNSDSTKRVIEENEYVLVLGYAPWCVRSAELMPQFAEAANKLKELGNDRVLMGKIDAERYPKVASDLGIKGFPTLLLFVNGTSQVYTGGFTGGEIVIWTQKKTGVPVVRINSKPEAEDFLKNHQTFVVGRFEKFEGSGHEEFAKTAIADNEMQFVEVSDINLARILYPDIKPSGVFLGIVKSEPEKHTQYEGILEKEKILQFLDHNRFPLVTKLTESNQVRVYSSSVKLQVMVFAETGDFEKMLEPLQNVARKFKSKVMFLYVDIEDENLAKPFLTLYGLEDTKDIVIAAFDSKISGKYLLEADPTPANIEDFSSKLLHGLLLPYYKSQPIPDNKDVNVTIVVGKTFDEVVLNSPKNILLEVHTPWCMNCETISKQVEKLARHFKDLDNLVIARIDASVNEHPKLQVTDYPALLFYPASDKSKPIKVSTKLSLKDMAKFISKHLKSKEYDPKDEL